MYISEELIYQSFVLMIESLRVSSIFVNMQFRAREGWMWVMSLTERSFDMGIMHGKCNCETFDCLGLSRFRMRTFIYSPPRLGGLDLER